MRYSFLLLLPFILGCEPPLKLNEHEVDSIRYQFFDASVAPEYQRNYSITVEPTSIYLVIDSYGDVLSEILLEIAPRDFNALVETINAAELRVLKPTEDDLCVGAPRESLYITAQGELVYCGFLDHCVSTEFPANAGDVESVVIAMKNLIPHFPENLY